MQPFEVRVLRVQSRRNFCSVLDFLFFFIFLSLFFSFLFFCFAYFLFLLRFSSRVCFVFFFVIYLCFFFEQRRRRLTAKLAAYVRAGVCVCVCVYVRVLVSLCVRVLASDEGSLPLTDTTNCRLNGLSGMQGVCECMCVCVRFPRSRSTKLRNCNSLAVTQLGAYGSSSSLCMRSSRSVCVCV